MSTEGNDKAELRKRLDDLSKLLHESAKAVSLSVSLEHFEKTIPVHLIAKNVAENYQNLIFTNIIVGINNGIQAIAEKMEALDKMAKLTPNNVDAWRPVAGNVDASAMEKYGLSMRKLRLQEKLEALSKENDSLKDNILEKRDLIQQKIEIIDRVRL